MTFIVIEALLATRIAGQATSQDPNWRVFGGLLTITDFLVAPFRDLRPEPVTKPTGVVEFSTLVAFEAYLVGFLVLIFLLQLTRISAWFIRRSRKPRRPSPTVVETPALEPLAAPLAIEPESSRQAA